jgi:predicted kinase
MMAEKIHSIILLRGLPGSGKSTLAKVLSENGTYPVYSIDDFFTSPTGSYQFDHAKNYLAYEDCRSKTEKAMYEKTEKIFVDNTFTMEWEMEPYFELADKNNYSIFVITVENYHGEKNIHNVTDEQLEKMRSKYKIRL